MKAKILRILYLHEFATIEFIAQIISQTDGYTKLILDEMEKSGLVARLDNREYTAVVK